MGRFLCQVPHHAEASLESNFRTYPIPRFAMYTDAQFACLFIDFFYFFSSYLVDTYFSSWTWVVTDWSVRHVHLLSELPLTYRPGTTPSS